MPELLKGLAIFGLVAGSLSHSLIFWLEPISDIYQPWLGGQQAGKQGKWKRNNVN